MQTGSLVRGLALILAATAASNELQAQMPVGPDPVAHPSKRAAIQARFDAMRGKNPYVDAYGQPAVVPASYCASCNGGGYGAAYACDSGVGGDGYDAGYYSDGYCGDVYYGEACANPYGMMGNGQRPTGLVERIKNAMAVGWLGGDQRGPHYFDVRAEAVWLEREDTFGQDIAFTSFNVADPITGPDVVLDSSDLDFDYEEGFRVMGRFDIGALSVLEFGYMGIYDYSTTASFTDPVPVDPVTGTGNLFSLFSDYGLNPATVAIQFGPMPESERSITHTIHMDSELQTAEMSFRRYWVGYSPRVSGTLLAGFRYTRLKEDFLFLTSGEADLDYFTRADNDLAGFQTGGDIWISLLQGLRVGAEGKAGIYNNHYSIDTNITATPPVNGPPTVSESFSEDQVAFIGEASADVVVDLLPSWSLRGGYEVLWLNSIALAGENFNPASPYGLPGQEPRVPFRMNQGEAFYHGWHAGLEFVW